MIRILILVVLVVLLPTLNASEEKPSQDTLLHDLRDFLPSSESTLGKDDDSIPAFSVQEGAYWKKYRRYNKSGSGSLSRTEIKNLVADLWKSLRTNYPDTYSAIDVDGDDTLTGKKFDAYMKKKP